MDNCLELQNNKMLEMQKLNLKNKLNCLNVKLKHFDILKEKNILINEYIGLECADNAKNKTLKK